MADNVVRDTQPDLASGASPFLVRLLGWVILAVMAVATAYTAWVAMTNLNRIGV